MIWSIRINFVPCSGLTNTGFIPVPGQEELINKTFGCCRLMYNTCIYLRRWLTDRAGSFEGGQWSSGR